jgi:hypothetical protein
MRSSRDVIRYLLCVLLSAIGWCGTLANILHYAWFLRSHLSDSGYSRYVPSYHVDFWWGIGGLSFSAFGSLLPAFLCAAVAITAWHFREKRPTKEEGK